ncbi:hypothetical protein G205_22670 [Arthrobacter nitrophenolicus]|uniref:Uncharacterized protein n=1 Tax=Arthrobacter nitrophenolicus TaxID=683150 RepID=L8TJ55_9MICC|nr:hypothetical protein G205_22670 [Arthrobacter nitrophenolicus]
MRTGHVPGDHRCVDDEGVNSRRFQFGGQQIHQQTLPGGADVQYHRSAGGDGRSVPVQDVVPGRGGERGTGRPQRVRSVIPQPLQLAPIRGVMVPAEIR